MFGWDGHGGQRKHVSLCEVGSDISRLSIDRHICLRELPQVKISTGAAVAVFQCQGSLLSLYLLAPVLLNTCELSV